MPLNNIIPVILLIHLTRFENNEALNCARFFGGIRYITKGSFQRSQQHLQQTFKELSITMPNFKSMQLKVFELFAWTKKNRNTCHKRSQISIFSFLMDLNQYETIFYQKFISFAGSCFKVGDKNNKNLNMNNPFKISILNS